MHFTREPIVQTCISPREGFKLVIRNSKTSGVEEYLVDAVEIITFGGALFFRSLERPKHFLLPVSDYEVVEVRETRMLLKHAEKASKTAKTAKAEPVEQPAPERKKRRQRRRRTTEEAPTVETAPKVEETPKAEEKPKEPITTTIIPPPTSLISENIDRYKEMVQEEAPVVASSPEEEEASKNTFSAARFLRRLTGREGEE